MGTTSDGGETIQLASESHLSWLQAGRRGAKAAGFAGYNSISKHGKIFGSINVSGETPHLPHPPKPWFCPKREVSVNVSLGEG